MLMLRSVFVVCLQFHLAVEIVLQTIKTKYQLGKHCFSYKSQIAKNTMSVDFGFACTPCRYI